MPRPIWTGHISFGLVNVPVTLYSAEQTSSDIRFQLLDRRNSARVRYQRVNEESGDEVPWGEIIKGYEYDKGNYILLTEEELKSAATELTKRIEIEQFVDAAAIDPVYFEKPYYLVPAKGGEKGYVLLREAMSRSKRVGVAQVAIRARGHLAALMPRDDALVLNLLRYAQELRPRDEFEFPHGKIAQFKIAQKELDLAGQLIDGMTSEWKPEDYHDEYKDALMKMIDKRIESGQTTAVSDQEEHESRTPATVNFMDVLKKSLGDKAKMPRKTAAARKKTTRRKVS